MKEIIFINGKFVAKDKAVVSAQSPGLQYGWGLFETMRSLNQRIVYFQEHLKRLKSSARRIGVALPYSVAALRDIVNETVRRNGYKDSYIRLSVYKGERASDIVVIVKKHAPYPWQRYRKGFRACISEFLQNENSLLCQIKTTHRLTYELAYQRAVAQGYDEALILNQRGYLCEGTRTNLFMVSGNALFTPALSSGCLEGITRNAVVAVAVRNRMRVKEKNITLKALLRSDEAFLTNSVRAVMPLVCVKRHRIAKEIVGPRTLFFIQEYQKLLHGGLNNSTMHLLKKEIK